MIRRLAIVTSDKNDQKAGVLGANSAPPRKTDLGATAGGKAPQTLDRWFDDQLNQLFNDVSSEPLPPDLAKLIGELKAQSRK